MALKLAQTIKGGFVAEYWRIVKFEINKDSKSATFYLGLFKDKAAADMSKESGNLGEYVLHCEVFNLNYGEFTADKLALIEPSTIAYTEIKKSNPTQKTENGELVFENGNAILDDNQNIVGYEQVPVMVETNKFALVEDC
jgi:hypothetical protein